MGYIVVFSANGLTLVIGEGYGLTQETAERIVDDLEYQGITARIENNLYTQV